MTQGSILECVKAIRGRYLSVSRKEKGKILAEFTNVTSLYRMASLASADYLCSLLSMVLASSPMLVKRGKTLSLNNDSSARIRS